MTSLLSAGNNTYLSSKEVEKLFKISKYTLLNWRKEGKINFQAINQRKFLYNRNDIEKLLGMPLEEVDKQDRINVIWTRVSSSRYKEDLEWQKAQLIAYAAAQGLQISHIYEEVASLGGYDSRPQYNRLIDSICHNEIANILIFNKSRISYFDYNQFERFCKNFQTQILILNKDQRANFSKETADDISSMLHKFRLDEIRTGRFKSQDIPNITIDIDS